MNAIKYLRHVILWIAVTGSIITYAQRHATGLVFDDDSYDQVQRLSPALKFGEVDIPVLSLKEYCPPVLSQGQMGSCVGWASGYAALSISNNIVATGAKPRSALYIYNQIKIGACSSGSQINKAMELLQAQGDCSMEEFNPRDCNRMPDADAIRKAAPFAIREFFKIFDLEAPGQEKVIATINALKTKRPVVIGMNLTESFDAVGRDGIWKPARNERVDGGHALCVIGYNDKIRMFEIMNSWGNGWGNNGFFQMSYDDYAEKCKYGYQFTLNNELSNNPSLTGGFKFKKYIGYSGTNSRLEFEEITPTLVGSEYIFSKNIVNLNDYFRIQAYDISKDSYVYIFSLKPDGSSEILFPLSSNEDGASIRDIPLVPSEGAVIEIPTDTKKGIIADQSGIDNLIILYAKKPVDITTVVKETQKTGGNVPERLRAALGRRLAEDSSITYSPSDMRFTAKANGGDVVPIVLKVEVKN